MKKTNSIKLLSLRSLLSILLSSSVVNAGAGAVVYGCIYLPTKQLSPITFSFTPYAVQCMNNTGYANSMVVQEAGVTCVRVGYVESKGSSSGGDLCATDRSIWNLGYTSTGGKWSNTAMTQWSALAGNGAWTITSMADSSHPKNIEVCQGPKDPSNPKIISGIPRCQSPRQDWHGMLENLYIIFNPTAS